MTSFHVFGIGMLFFWHLSSPPPVRLPVRSRPLSPLLPLLLHLSALNCLMSESRVDLTIKSRVCAPRGWTGEWPPVGVLGKPDPPRPDTWCGLWPPPSSYTPIKFNPSFVLRQQLRQARDATCGLSIEEKKRIAQHARTQRERLDWKNQKLRNNTLDSDVGAFPILFTLESAPSNSVVHFHD